MVNEKIEKRECQRFEIPGATISYKKKGIFSYPDKYKEEICPIIDISRGGLRFICKEHLKSKSKVSLKVSIPGENIPLSPFGRVIWVMPYPGKNHKYQIGIQFNPYGPKKGQNNREILEKIKIIEKKLAGKQ